MKKDKIGIALDLNDAELEIWYQISLLGFKFKLSDSKLGVKACIFDPGLFTFNFCYIKRFQNSLEGHLIKGIRKCPNFGLFIEKIQSIVCQ